MLKSALVLLSGNSLFYLALFIRNLIVARLISVEDYGIAATFAISMAIVEMMSTLGLQHMIIQDKRGEEPIMQATLQGFNFLRSFISAGALFAISQPLANFLGIPDLAWAYQLLAIVPIISGLTHFDIYRLERKMEFLPRMLSHLVPTIISILVIWPLYNLYGDYRVMLYSLLTQWVLTTVFSHYLAKRTYRMAFNKEIMIKAFRFGWPILLASLVLFIIFNGEKLIVGNALGVNTLAWFAMGITLTLTPTLVLEASIQAFFLPQLSRERENSEKFRQLSMTVIQTYLILGLVFVLGVVLLGEPVANFLLGQKYEAVFSILPWLAIIQTLRMFKAGCIIISLAVAQTENTMIVNLARVFVLPFSWYVVNTTGNLMHVIWIAVAGELIGFVVALILIKWRLKLSLRALASSIILALICLVLMAYYSSMEYGMLPEITPKANILIIISLLFVTSIFKLGFLHQYIKQKGRV